MSPGERYAARIYTDGNKLGTAFENVVFKSGEVRELGDLRLQPPLVAERGTLDRSLVVLARRDDE